MKVKLLKKLRNIGRSQINIYSITKTNGVNTGMSIGYNDEKYARLFEYDDTEEEVLKKAERRYLIYNITLIREKYKKYSVKN